MNRLNRTGAALWVVLLTLASVGATGLGFGGPLATRSAAATITLGPGGTCGDCDACNPSGSNEVGHDFSAAEGGDWAGPAHTCISSPTGNCNGAHIHCGALANSDGLALNRPEMLAELVYDATFDPTGAKAAELQREFPELTRVVDGGQFLEVRRICDPRVVDALIPLTMRAKA